MGVVSWTLAFLRPYRGKAAAIFALSLLEIGLAALAPWPLKVIVDYVLDGLALPPALAALTPSAIAGSAVAVLVVVVVCPTIGPAINSAASLSDAIKQTTMPTNTLIMSSRIRNCLSVSF